MLYAGREEWSHVRVELLSELEVLDEMACSAQETEQLVQNHIYRGVSKNAVHIWQEEQSLEWIKWLPKYWTTLAGAPGMLSTPQSQRKVKPSSFDSLLLKLPGSLSQAMVLPAFLWIVIERFCGIFLHLLLP